MSEPTPVTKTSPDINEERLDQLKDLFPEAFTEGRIDFDKLRTTLGDIVDDRHAQFRQLHKNSLPHQRNQRNTRSDQTPICPRGPKDHLWQATLRRCAQSSLQTNGNSLRLARIRCRGLDSVFELGQFE